MKHTVKITNSAGKVSFAAKRLIKRAVAAALETERVETQCLVEVLLVDDGAIREINSRTRNIDKATDVLSFPMLSLEPGRANIPDAELDPDTGLCHLGDMVISVERAKAQAAEYGHSFERELGYLTVHSVMHLLGYDHVDEGEDQKLMRSREEAALKKLNLTR